MRSGLIYAPMASTAAAVARALADAGITRVFGLPGGEVLVLMDELRRAGVDFVLMRHEANAGIAAAVYGKLRGQPGVVPAPDTGSAVAAPPRPGNAADKARELLRLLKNARRPLVAIGLGIDPANAPRIRRWVTDWNLPVVVTPKVKGIVDETAANFVGVVSGMAADGLMCDALAAADLLIGFGLDPVEIDKTWHVELPIHWILEAPHVGGPGFSGRVPPGTTLIDHAQLLDALASAPAGPAWSEPFGEFQRARRDMLQGRAGADGAMWPGDLVQALAAALPPDTIVTTDVGSHKYLFGQFWPSRQPETFWMSNGLSGMAYGLSAAIGAKLARPDAPVLAAVGDGGFSMNAQELETAARVGAPFVTVVLEDGGYSLISLAQEGKKLESYRMDFRPIDTVKMAEACGVDGLRTHDPAELALAARRAVERRRSLVIALPVNYADYRRLF